MIERIVTGGHKNVTARHRTTLEVTKDRDISTRADCIIGVNSDKGIKDLSEEFKKSSRRIDATIEMTIRVGDVVEKITGKGHPELSFTHEKDIVVRKSDYICERTLMIKADKKDGCLPIGKITPP
jgi:hypothetical protein